MTDEYLQTYILDLPVAPFHISLLPQEEALDIPPDMNDLPDAFLAGGNVVEFAPGAAAKVKAGVALCLLAAQQTAEDDSVIATPEQWIERRNTVLTNLNWRVGKLVAERRSFRRADSAVKEAIIPFLEEAFAEMTGGGSTILEGLRRMQEATKHRPWFAMFDRHSSRLSVTEYQFSTVTVQEDVVQVRLASARFDASYGRTQVLFFHKTKESASFDGLYQDLSTNTAALLKMHDTLRDKLAGLSRSLIRSLQIG